MAANKFGFGVRDLMLFPLKEETDTATPTYDTMLDTTDTNSIKASRTTANATADGDDKQVANITMTTGMTIEWTGWGVPVETEAKIYGHTLDSTKNQLDEAMDDLAPYIGVGYVRTMTDKSNAKTFKGYFYYKCQAVQGDEESTSAGTSLNLASTTVTFNAVQPSYGPLRSIEEFDTEDAAVAWIKGLAGATA